MEENSFIMKNEDGTETKYDVLFTFQGEENLKNYIVYTDNSKDEEGNVSVYASIYHPEEENPRLEAIETEKEWKVIETILNTIQEELREEENDNK